MPPNGELLEVIPSPEGELPDLSDIKVGYLRFLWKEGELAEGFLLVKEGRVCGAALEYVLSKKEKFGEDALRDIVKQIENGRIKTIEIYHSERKIFNEFLDLFPQVKVSPALMCSLKQVGDPKILLECIENHCGTLVLNGPNAKWVLHVKRGEILKAVQISAGGEVREGDDAIRALVKSIPSLLGNIAAEFLPSVWEDSGGKMHSMGNYLLYVLDILSWKPRVENGSF